MSLDKKSVSELKDLLKAAGMSQNGEKGMLVYRLKLLATAKEYSMEFEGKNVCLLKPADLKKVAARNGVSPIGNNDEILAALVEALKAKGKPAAATENKESSGPSGATGEVDPIALAKRVLELEELGDSEGILNIATTRETRISKSSSVAVMRKAYLKLSLLIHPDKLGRSFEHATKAFQALVRAFERLSSPDLIAEEMSFGRKAQEKTVLSVARSNDGCFRTRVCCPRCKQAWSEGGLDGNPDYFYNFMMTGLKQFTCSTCLFHFGCMTAIHKCLGCNRQFEYSPQDYHRKIKCGSPKCNKTFGFFMYHASERVIKELKQTLREEQEIFIRNREAKLRRAQRSGNRALSVEDEEKAFSLGLIDCCPRCGESFEDYEDEDSQRLHLVECMDDKKHAEFKAKRLEKLRKEQEMSMKADKQQSVQSRATWEFLGSETSQLYLLDDTQLRGLAEEKGLTVDKSMSKAAVIAEVANRDYAQSASNMLIENGSGSNTRRKMTSESLPSGYQSFSFEQLQALCASYGFISDSTTKADLLDEIEAEIFKYEEVIGRSIPGANFASLQAEKGPLMIMGDEEDHFVPNKRPVQSIDGSSKRKKVISEDDGDEDFSPDE